MIDCVGAGSITHLCATSSFRLLRNLSRQKFALASRGILDVFFEVSRIKAFPPVVGGTSLGRSLPRACPVASSWLAECAKLSQGQDVGFPCRIMRWGFAPCTHVQYTSLLAFRAMVPGAGARFVLSFVSAESLALTSH